MHDGNIQLDSYNSNLYINEPRKGDAKFANSYMLQLTLRAAPERADQNTPGKCVYCERLRGIVDNFQVSQ